MGIWGKYPHETHAAANHFSTITWVTAIYLMVMSFLKEIVFTIFSTIPIQVTYKDNSITTRQKVIGVVWVCALLCAIFCDAVMVFAAICCIIVLVAAMEVCLSKEEDLSSMRQKLLEP